jgi:hypothetical protein
MKNTTVTGRKRKVDYDEVLAYVAANPAMFQSEVAAHFGISQCRVSHICIAAGGKGTRRGRPVRAKDNLTDLENEWEAILHQHGLGMERGLRLNNERILYGYDPLMGSPTDASATFAAN